MTNTRSLVEEAEPLEPEDRMLVAIARKASDRGRHDLAVALAWSSIETVTKVAGGHGYQLVLRTPGWAHDLVAPACIGNRDEPAAIAELASAAARASFTVSAVSCYLDEDTRPWRLALWREIGERLGNQGVIAFAGAYHAMGMRFKSWSEVVLAEELARRDIPMMAGPAYLWHGQLREPDFIVFVNGKAFVVEVHGAPWHPPGRSAIDFGRNLIYRLAGLEVLMFDASEVRADPGHVVDTITALASVRDAA